MRIDEIVHQNVLYHATGAWNIAKIFAEHRIGFTLATGSDIQAGSHNAEKIYFLSCTRSKVGHYSVVHEGSTAGAVLVLNADWLKHNLTVRPVDYWGREYRQVDPKRNEMEERVYSREPYLELPQNTTDLILAIHLAIGEPDDRFRASLMKTIIGAKRAGVPLYGYREKRAWLLQDTRRALPPDQLLALIKAIPIPPPYGIGGVRYRRPGDFGGYVELFTRPVEDRKRLTKAAQLVLRNLTPWGLARRDAARSIEANVHNARSPGQIGHENLLRFMQFLRQNGYVSIDAFLAHLSQKWYPPER